MVVLVGVHFSESGISGFSCSAALLSTPTKIRMGSRGPTGP